jgi:hypothetical protein
MRKTATPSKASLLAVSALSLAGCVETTAPVDVVEVRVAHVAPGLGTQAVLMDGQKMFELPALQAAFFPLETQPMTYGFAAGGDTVSTHVAQHGDINAIVLMNPDQPAAHHFPLERLLFRVRLMVINGDFTTGDPLTVRIVRGDFEFEENIAPGDHAVIEPDGPGTFDLWARPVGADEMIPIQSFSVVAGDNGFLIIIPHPDPDTDYARILF